MWSQAWYSLYTLTSVIDVARGITSPKTLHISAHTTRSFYRTLGAYPTFPVWAQCICGTLDPHPSSVESASMTIPNGADASVVFGVADHTSRQALIMAGRRQAYPSLSSTLPAWYGRLFSPWYLGEERGEGTKYTMFFIRRKHFFERYTTTHMRTE